LLRGQQECGMNIFPSDFDPTLTGFGGDPNMNKEQHRKCIKKTPSDVKKTYGVSVAKPTVEITPTTPKFTDSLEVQAKTSSGKIYYSLDGMHYNEGSRVKISQTHTVYFIAIDKGNASEVVYRFYEIEAD
jgi:hypothetical protein